MHSRSPLVPRFELPSDDQQARPGSETAFMSAQEMHESVDRARSYALLWLLMRNDIMRQVDQLEEDRKVQPKPPLTP